MKLLVHGGAGWGPGGNEEAYKAGIEAALEAGAEAESALEAALLATQSLERDALFNAGRGSSLAADGKARMDASIATSDGRAGAVGDVVLAHSAVSAALLVMIHSPHTLLAGEEADKWIKQNGRTSSPKKRVTREQKRLLASRQKVSSMGTVGAVSLDSVGKLAAATSTGGVRGKAPGRIGDSAIHGAGTWCSSECAISFTGDGDKILARSSAARVAKDIESGKKPKKSIRRELRALERMGGYAGCIVLLASGKGYALRNCSLMHWGETASEGLHIPISTE